MAEKALTGEYQENYEEYENEINIWVCMYSLGSEYNIFMYKQTETWNSFELLLADWEREIGW